MHEIKPKIIFGLCVFFSVMIGLLIYLLIIREQPLYNTVKERREAERARALQTEIEKDVQEALEKRSENAETPL